jgi:hypothetical protein
MSCSQLAAGTERSVAPSMPAGLSQRGWFESFNFHPSTFNCVPDVRDAASPPVLPPGWFLLGCRPNLFPLRPMHLLAAATQTTVDRLKDIPMDVWLKIGAGVAALILVVVVLRKLARMNKVVLGVVVVVGLSFVGFSWIYNRDEPAWATPVVERLADFFPSKGKAGR